MRKKDPFWMKSRREMQLKRLVVDPKGRMARWPDTIMGTKTYTYSLGRDVT